MCVLVCFGFAAGGLTETPQFVTKTMTFGNTLGKTRQTSTGQREASTIYAQSYEALVDTVRIGTTITKVGIEVF